MPSGLQSASFTVAEVLSGPFLLNVPVYQRPYAWTPDEAGQLLDDIVEAAGIESGLPPDPDYFLGTVLLMDAAGGEPVRLSSKMASREFDIVDGQQRLVTLLTLVAVLRDLDRTTRRSIARRASVMITAHRGGRFFRAQRSRILLAERERTFFENYVLRPESTGVAPVELPAGPEKFIFDVRDHFVSVLSEYSNEDRLRLFDYVMEHCELVVILSDDIDRAYRMFIVLNERGKKLQRNDILKADVIRRLEPADMDWAVREWDAASARLGGDFETFFSHLRTIYGHTRPQIVSAVRAVMREEGGAAPFLRNAFLPLASTFAAMRANDPDAYGGLSARMRWYLHFLNRLPDGDWAPAATLALKDRHANPAGSERVLSEIDRLAHLLRILCLGTGRRKRRFSDVVDAIRSGEAADPSHPVWNIPRDEVRNMGFHLKDLHKRNQKMCKLLLLRLNDELAGKISGADPDRYTVEHVLPQRPPGSSEWRVWFPASDERGRCTESLGNLVLVTQQQNDKARNATFVEKKIIFRQGGDVLSITRAVLERPEWRAADIEAREEQLFDLMRTLWRIDLPRAKAPDTAPKVA